MHGETSVCIETKDANDDMTLAFLQFSIPFIIKRITFPFNRTA